MKELRLFCCKEMFFIGKGRFVKVSGETEYYLIYECLKCKKRVKVIEE